MVSTPTRLLALTGLDLVAGLHNLVARLIPLVLADRNTTRSAWLAALHLALNVGGHGPHYSFSLTHGTGTNKMGYDETMIDFFICCSIEGNRYWIVPVKEVTVKTLKIFLDGQKYHEYEGAWDLLH